MTGLTTGALAGVDLGEVAIVLVVAPSVALAIYLTTTVLSIFKPWAGRPTAAAS